MTAESRAAMRWLWLLIAVGIAYGSLFPFAFDRALPAEGVIAHLLDSLSKRPSRGDLVSNFVLYLPLGFAGALAVREGRPHARTLVTVVACGSAESLGLELLQLFDSARSASLWDLALNAVSTAAGAGAGLAIRGPRVAIMSGIVVRDRFAVVMVACWLAYRLAPFVPTLDLAHMKDAVKAIRDATAFDLTTCLRQTVAWLVVGIALRTAANLRRTHLVTPALGLCTSLAPLILTGRILRLEEFAAVALAAAIRPFLPPSRRATLLVLIAHIAAVAFLQLEPFRLDATAHAFSLVPFSGILRGSLDVGVFAVFEKFFLYGVAIWLPVRLGRSVSVTTAVVAGLVLVTEVVQTRLPGRTAEIGEPLIAVIAGLTCGALRPRYSAAP